MLTVGSNSTCDVCLEPFGPENKSPCSINCGHVFCASCLDHITRSNCPLCRTPYNHNTIVRLHVDLDGSQSSPPATVPSTEPEQEARRFQEAFARIINKGSSEADLRKLLGETRAFLQTQPRDKFTELRVTQKLTVYLCEVKTSLLEYKRKVDHCDRDVRQLQEEKTALREQIKTMSEANQKTMEEAKWLRAHADKAQEAYVKLVE
ncbi:hypothetical protein BDQ17DRAFT_1425887 [Cyathus striatus]|nr:hypothetical protein BDQ17DRAFT_1425887 [Cyathus striatus]